MSIGFTEIMVILGVVVLLFGAKRIPELARALGRASYEFKKAKEEIKRGSSEVLDAAEEQARKEAEAAKTDDSGKKS